MTQLQDASKKLHHGRKQFLKGVTRQSQALQYMFNELQHDRIQDIARGPLADHSRSLQRSSTEHLAEHEAVQRALSEQRRALRRASRELGRDNSARGLLTRQSRSLEAVTRELACDGQVMPKAMDWNSKVLRYTVASGATRAEERH